MSHGAHRQEGRRAPARLLVPAQLDSVAPLDAQIRLNSARGIADDTGLGLEPNAPGAMARRLAAIAALRSPSLQRRPSLGEAEEAVAGEPVGASAETPELVRRGSGRASRRSRAGSRLEGLEPSELITNMAEMSAYEYKASSPDEKAFVDTCRSYGYVFCGVDDEDNAVLRVFERPPDARVQPQPVVGMLPHGARRSRACPRRDRRLQGGARTSRARSRASTGSSTFAVRLGPQVHERHPAGRGRYSTTLIQYSYSFSTNRF